MSEEVKYIIGIDEAGRGPLAGPVAVGACLLPFDMKRSHLMRKVSRVGIRKLNNSKKLSEKSRDSWFAQMNKMKLHYAVAMVPNTVIDGKGLSPAIRKAMSQTLQELKQKVGFKASQCLVLLDGGLRAPKRFKHQKTIIQGDEKEFQISLASIAAKVTRDSYMKKMAKLHPSFNFEIHKGYGTARHIATIKRQGVTPLHRMSFLRRVL
jgi:ribonuclease HII